MKPLLRVLLIEDSEDDAELLVQELRRGGYQLQTDRVVNEDELRRALARTEWDVVFAAFRMQHFSAPAALAVAQELAPDIPFLIVSGAVGEEAAVDGLHAGAHDFILKGQWARLLPSLARTLRDADERRRRRRAEADYLQLFNEMMDGFALHEILTDDQGHPVDYRFLAVNPAFERMTGLAAADVVGRSAREVLPTLEASWIETYGRVALSGEPARFEQYAAPLDKHFRVAAFCPTHGRFATIFTDVTERRQMEEALQRSESRLRSVLSSVQEIIYSGDVSDDALAGPIHFAGAAVESIFGLTEEAMRSDPSLWFASIHPDDAPALAAETRQALQDGRPRLRIYRCKNCTTGEYRWLEDQFMPQTDDQGRVVGFFGAARDTTEQRRADEHMRELAERHRTMLATISVGFCLVGDTGRILDVNDAYSAMSGYTRDELLRLTVFDLEAQESREETAEHLRRIEETGVDRFESRHRTKRRTTFDVEVSVSFASATKQFYVFIQDITARKQAVEALRRSEARFHGAFEHAPIGMALVAPDSRWMKVNRALCELIGYSEEELLRLTVHDLAHAEDVEADRAQMRRMLAGEIPIYQTEKRYFHKSGTVVWVLLSVSLVWNERNRPLYFIAQIQNISARKGAEVAIRLQTSALTAAANAIVITDRTGSIEWVNPAWTALTGYTAAETVGQKPNLLKSSVHDPATYEQLWATILAGEVWRGELVNRRKDGSLYTEDQTITPLTDEHGQITHFIGIKQDITERQEAIARLRAETARTQALLSTSRQLNTSLDLNAVLHTTCVTACEALHVSAAVINFFDAERRRFTFAASHGLPEDYGTRHRPADHSLHGDGPHHAGRTVTVIPDIQAVADATNAQLFRELDFRTLVMVPMRYAGQLIGGLMLVQIGETREFAGAELELVAGLGDLAAIAITNARLFDQANRRMERLRALNAIDRAITVPQTLAAAFETVVEQVTAQLQVDAAAILVYDAEREALDYVAGAGFRGDAIRRTPVPLGAGTAGRAASERQTQFYDTQDHSGPDVRSDLIAEEGFVSHYSVPLVAHGQLLGVLDIFQRSRLDPDAEWLSFLESLALQAAIAIDHAALFTRTQEQTRRLDQVLNTVPEGIVLLDASRRLVMANPEGRRCLDVLGDSEVGSEITKLGGMSIAPLLAPGPQAVAMLDIVLREDDRAFEVTAKPVEDDGATVGWILLLRDVTESRRSRRAQAQQERLATIGQLAAGIAHDFNNILTPIRLSVDLSLDQAPEGGRLGNNLKQIGAAVDRARDLVSQILAFSRREAQIGRMPVRMQPIVEEALRLMRAGMPAQIEIRSLLQDEDAQVLAIPGQIHQIVMNLCTNAYHAMQARGGVLTLMLQRVDLVSDLPTNSGLLPPGNYVRLTVGDTGHGMDQATMSRIFEPFFTTKSPVQGTGMGLSVVFGIVAESGGGILVRSVPGEGSEFAVYLPRHDAQAGAAPQDRQTTRGGRERILVVDDEISITMTLRDVLEHLGYSVATASSGSLALAMLEEAPTNFDLVITDLTMPQMSGLELAAMIAARRADLPVILMSGYAEMVGPEAYVKAGVRDFLTKPFTAQTVDVIIRNAFAT